MAALRADLDKVGAGPDAVAELKADLAERDHAAVLQATFARLSYDPTSGGERTFWLVVLSLLVCVVGIVNTMTMAVTERFREIATMKCLGALDSFILKAFLIESAAMGLVGAMVGAVLGLVLVLLQAWITFGSAFWGAFPVHGLVQASSIAVGCGLGLAIIGALMPAFQASRMAPIEAMRVDL
jgi:ABC-type lipoprotein release transport system permease subunit